jgi:hypothetical protein
VGPAPEKKEVARIIMEMRNGSAAGVDTRYRGNGVRLSKYIFLKSDALAQRMTTGNLHSVTWYTRYMRRYYYLD